MSSPGMPYREVPTGLTAEQAMIMAAQQPYQQQQERLRAALLAAILAMWATAAAAGALNPSAAAKWVSSLLPISSGAQRAMVAATQARLAQQVRETDPISISPDSIIGEGLRGVDPEDVYERPFTTVRYELSKGKPMDAALDAGRRRAQSIVMTDLQLAHTHTARSYLREAQRRQLGRQREDRTRRPDTPREPRAPRRTITGYRRQLSNKPNHCALCILASTQRYHVDKLMPIHPNCGCTCVPVYDTQMPHVVDPRLARQVHDAVRRDLGERYVDAGGRLGDAHYRDIIITNEHGEIGPVLGVRGQHFQGRPGGPRRLGHERVNPDDEPETDVVDLDDI